MKKLLFVLAMAGMLLFLLYGRINEKNLDGQVVESTAVTTPMPSKNDHQLVSKIGNIVSTENSALPKMVDSQTRLDRVSAGPGAQLTYFYTLPNYASIDVNRSWITIDVKPKVTKNVCADQELRKLLIAGATLMYVYKGKDGVYINQFQVTQHDCLR